MSLAAVHTAFSREPGHGTLLAQLEGNQGCSLSEAADDKLRMHQSLRLAPAVGRQAPVTVVQQHHSLKHFQISLMGKGLEGYCVFLGLVRAILPGQQPGGPP